MILGLESVTHRYGSELAVDDVSFGLDAGELVGLLGPSGCGKTTIVQAIAGHVRPTSGRVTLRGVDVTDSPPESRRVSVVFQRSTLYPHMTVGENVAYGLAARDIDPDRRDEVVEDYLELVSLEDQRTASPAELSGGQRRRGELARALAPEPDVLVLDEPLSALDRALRERLRNAIERIQRDTGVTTLFVTHDQETAMALADRLVVMNDGRVAASGTPRTLYESPPTPFVASFLGRSNTVSATILERQPLTLSFGGRESTLLDSSADSPPGTTVTCHVRPADLSVRSSSPDDGDGAGLSLAGEITHVADLGRRYDVTVRLETGDEIVIEQPSHPPGTGEPIAVDLPTEALTVFDQEPGNSTDSNSVSDPRK